MTKLRGNSIYFEIIFWRGLTIAGLMMFGEERSIADLFPNYFLDNREILSEIPGERWSNRITSQDGTWSGNLYDLYFKVIGKIISDIDIPFQIQGNDFIRQSVSQSYIKLLEKQFLIR
ncbi:hypothetical protein MUO14_07950 [Halobacillus shinanisalinarum]|uniref:Uncharacterized protein n=1 Tax=Halobacillus shinanisalinarum TaxID=2932258 RepID=A0ABY4H4M6_9BACI|nr:hypothetical protein [Halobacillus shinanisalinarum]UOQ94850.1 hypothetical protein MUO14_07950 [Halobacillus shinanisalinarum]